ncbi:MAG: HAMP domain-containing histidine kinase [Pseudomonadota bacterium]|nr:HAMP domain-containing histidine kinase [Pseudomonadota bacterium]
MFLKTLRSLGHTLALRLTIWYAGIFAASSILAFTLVYASVVSVVQERTDADLEEDIEELASFMQSGGLDRVKTEIAAETQGEEASQAFFRLWAPDGRELMATDLSSWPGLGNPLEVLAKVDSADEPILTTLALPRRADKVRIIYGTIAPGLVLEIGESLEDDEELIAALLRGFLITLVAVTMLGGPIGWFMARRALRGVQEITRTATEIADGALDRRVEVRSQGDELDTLARTFNTMVDRIQALVIGMREMTDNLAHDLRSPLARIRASAETGLTSGGSKTEAEALAAAITEECDRLLEIINTTLDIAEAESGAAKLKLTDIDLVELVHDALELFQPIAEDKQITITADSPDHCRSHGDRQRLQRVVANLLDNGLKYTPTGGRVTIKLVAEGGRVALSIEDTGIGISSNESARIFERFYRCDRSRSKQGNGLGLSLALAFVRAHGGDITVNSTPGQGSTFTVALPQSRHGRYLQL